MDANALKKLTRSEIQQLAKREGLKANVKTKVIIEQLVRKYSEGVPELLPATNTGNHSRQAKAESSTEKSEGENKSGMIGATETQPEGNLSATSRIEKQDAITHDADVADLLSMSVVSTDIKNKSAKSESPVPRESKGREAIESEGDAEVAALPHKNEGTMLKEVSTSAAAVGHIAAPKAPASSVELSTTATSSSSPERQAMLVPAFNWEQTSARQRATMEHAAAEHHGSQSDISSARRHVKDILGKTYHASSASAAQGRAQPSSDNPFYDNPSSSVPSKESPSQSQGIDGPREARVKELLRKIAEKTKEAKYWASILADAKATMENADAENKELDRQRHELERRRKVAERCFMMLKKQNNGENTKETSDEVPSSDFVATSNLSSIEGEMSAMKELQAVCAGKKTYFGKQRMASNSD